MLGLVEAVVFIAIDDLLLFDVDGNDGV